MWKLNALGAFFFYPISMSITPLVTLFHIFVRQKGLQKCSTVSGGVLDIFFEKIWGFPSHLLGSARRKATPSFLEPTQPRDMPRAPPRCSAEIQTCVVMHPRPPCLPRSRKCEKEPTAAGEQYAKKKLHLIHTRYTDSTLG